MGMNSTRGHVVLLAIFVTALSFGCAPEAPDDTVPTVTIDALLDLYYADGETIDVSGTASDAGNNLVRVEVRANSQLLEATLNGNAWSAQITPAGEGPVVIIATAVDAAGFQAQTDPIEAIVDLTDPVLNIVFPPDGVYLGPSADVGGGGGFTPEVIAAAEDTGSGFDDATTVTLYEEGGSDICTRDLVNGQVIFDDCPLLGGEGTYALRARVDDLAGNSENSNTVNITVDLTAPTANMVAFAGGNDCNGIPCLNSAAPKTQVFTVDTDAGENSIVEMCVNDVCESPIVIPAATTQVPDTITLQDGLNYIYARVTDRGDNTTVSASERVIWDPGVAVQIVDPPPGGNTFTEIVDVDAGTAGIQYDVQVSTDAEDGQMVSIGGDSAVVTGGAATVRLTLASGNNDLTAMVNDIAGNSAMGSSNGIMLDQFAPTFTFSETNLVYLTKADDLQPANPGIQRNFTITANDGAETGVDGIVPQVKLNGRNVVMPSFLSATSNAVVRFREGFNELTVTAADQVGHVGTQAVIVYAHPGQLQPVRGVVRRGAGVEPNATVTLYSALDRSIVVATDVTDGTGTYNLVVPPGRYSLLEACESLGCDIGPNDVATSEDVIIPAADPGQDVVLPDLDVFPPADCTIQGTLGLVPPSWNDVNAWVATAGSMGTLLDTVLVTNDNSGTLNFSLQVRVNEPFRIAFGMDVDDSGGPSMEGDPIYLTDYFDFCPSAPTYNLVQPFPVPERADISGNYAGATGGRVAAIGFNTGPTPGALLSMTRPNDDGTYALPAFAGLAQQVAAFVDQNGDRFPGGGEIEMPYFFPIDNSQGLVRDINVSLPSVRYISGTLNNGIGLRVEASDPMAPFGGVTSSAVDPDTGNYEIPVFSGVYDLLAFSDVDMDGQVDDIDTADGGVPGPFDEFFFPDPGPPVDAVSGDVSGPVITVGQDVIITAARVANESMSVNNIINTGESFDLVITVFNRGAPLLSNFTVNVTSGDVGMASIPVVVGALPTNGAAQAVFAATELGSPNGQFLSFVVEFDPDGIGSTGDESTQIFSKTVGGYLLVDDDSSSIGFEDFEKTYASALTRAFQDHDTHDVLANTDGPSVALMQSYGGVIWFTGSSDDLDPNSNTLTPSDVANIVTYLDDLDANPLDRFALFSSGYLNMFGPGPFTFTTPSFEFDYLGLSELFFTDAGDDGYLFGTVAGLADGLQLEREGFFDGQDSVGCVDISVLDTTNLDVVACHQVDPSGTLNWQTVMSTSTLEGMDSRLDRAALIARIIAAWQN